MKAGRDVDQKGLRGLRSLRDALGEQFHAGFYLNTGTEAYRIDDRIYVCPVDRLWSENRRDVNEMSTTLPPTGVYQGLRESWTQPNCRLIRHNSLPVSIGSRFHGVRCEPPARRMFETYRPPLNSSVSEPCVVGG